MISPGSVWSQDSTVADDRKTGGGGWGGSVVQEGILKQTERFTVKRHQYEKASVYARYTKEAVYDTRSNTNRKGG